MFDDNIMLCFPSASPDSFRGGPKPPSHRVRRDHTLVGHGLRAVYPGAEEVPDDDQNDVRRGDVGQDAAVPAQEVQCGGLMYVVAAGVCIVSYCSSIFQTFQSTSYGVVVSCVWRARVLQGCLRYR